MKLTKADFDPCSKTPISDYPPSQRGLISAKRKCPMRGTRYLHDGDTVPDECPSCQEPLRVERRKGQPTMLWCPCGFREEALALWARTEGR